MCFNSNDVEIQCPDSIKGKDQLELKIEKSSDETFKLNLEDAKKYVFRIRACSGADDLRYYSSFYHRISLLLRRVTNRGPLCRLTEMSYHLAQTFVARVFHFYIHSFPV